MTRKRGTIFLYVFGAFFALAISGCSMISTAYALDAADAQCTAGLYSCDYPNHQDGQPCMRNKPCAEVKDSCVVSGVCDAPNHCNDTSACGKAPQLTKPLSSYMPPPAAIGANGQADYSQTAQPASVAPVSTKPADTFENSALPSPDNVGGPTPSVTAPAAQPSIPFSPDALSPNPTYTPPNGQGVNLTNDTIQQVSQLSPPNTDAPNSRGITPSPTPTDAPSTFGSGAPTPSVSANTEACSWGCALAKTESSVVSALKTAGNWVASVVSTISPDTSDAQNLNLTSPHSSSLETDPQLSVQNGTNAAADAFAKQQQLGDVINKDTLVLNTDVRTRDYINSSPWATPSGIIGPNTTFPLSLDANAYDTNNQTYQITGGFGQSKADLFSSNANLLGGTSATVDTSGMSSDWKNYYASFNSAYVFDGYQYDPKTGSLTATYWSPPATGADLEAMKYATDANTYNQNVNALNTFSSPSNVALVKYGAAITAEDTLIATDQSAIDVLKSQKAAMAGLSTDVVDAQINHLQSEIDASAARKDTYGAAAEYIVKNYQGADAMAQALAAPATTPQIAAEQSAMTGNMSAAVIAKATLPEVTAGASPSIVNTATIMQSNISDDYSAASKVNTDDLIRNAQSYAANINNGTPLPADQQKAINAMTGNQTGTDAAYTWVANKLAAPGAVLSYMGDPFAKAIWNSTVMLPSTAFDQGLLTFNGPTTPTQWANATVQTDLQNFTARTEAGANTALNMLVVGSAAKSVLSNGFPILGSDIAPAVYNDARLAVVNELSLAPETVATRETVGITSVAGGVLPPVEPIILDAVQGTNGAFSVAAATTPEAIAATPPAVSVATAAENVSEVPAAAASTPTATLQTAQAAEYAKVGDTYYRVSGGTFIPATNAEVTALVAKEVPTIAATAVIADSKLSAVFAADNAQADALTKINTYQTQGQPVVTASTPSQLTDSLAAGVKAEVIPAEGIARADLSSTPQFYNYSIKDGTVSLSPITDSAVIDKIQSAGLSEVAASQVSVDANAVKTAATNAVAAEVQAGQLAKIDTYNGGVVTGSTVQELSQAARSGGALDVGYAATVDRSGSITGVYEYDALNGAVTQIADSNGAIADALQAKGLSQITASDVVAQTDAMTAAQTAADTAAARANEVSAAKVYSGDVVTGSTMQDLNKAVASGGTADAQYAAIIDGKGNITGVYKIDSGSQSLVSIKDADGAVADALAVNPQIEAAQVVADAQSTAALQKALDAEQRAVSDMTANTAAVTAAKEYSGAVLSGGDVAGLQQAAKSGGAFGVRYGIVVDQSSLADFFAVDSETGAVSFTATPADIKASAGSVYEIGTDGSLTPITNSNVIATITAGENPLLTVGEALSNAQDLKNGVAALNHADALAAAREYTGPILNASDITQVSQARGATLLDDSAGSASEAQYAKLSNDPSARYAQIDPTTGTITPITNPEIVQALDQVAATNPAVNASQAIVDAQKSLADTITANQLKAIDNYKGVIVTADNLGELKSALNGETSVKPQLGNGGSYSGSGGPLPSSPAPTSAGSASSVTTEAARGAEPLVMERTVMENPFTNMRVAPAETPFPTIAEKVDSMSSAALAYADPTITFAQDTAIRELDAAEAVRAESIPADVSVDTAHEISVAADANVTAALQNLDARGLQQLLTGAIIASSNGATVALPLTGAIASVSHDIVATVEIPTVAASTNVGIAAANDNNNPVPVASAAPVPSVSANPTAPIEVPVNTNPFNSAPASNDAWNEAQKQIDAFNKMVLATIGQWPSTSNHAAASVSDLSAKGPVGPTAGATAPAMVQSPTPSIVQQTPQPVAVANNPAPVTTQPAAPQTTNQVSPTPAPIAAAPAPEVATVAPAPAPAASAAPSSETAPSVARAGAAPANPLPTPTLVQAIAAKIAAVTAPIVSLLTGKTTLTPTMTVSPTPSATPPLTVNVAFTQLSLPADSPILSAETIPAQALTPDVIDAIKGEQVPEGYTYLYRGIDQPYAVPESDQQFTSSPDGALFFLRNNPNGTLIRIAVPNEDANPFSSPYAISRYGPLTPDVLQYPYSWFTSEVPIWRSPEFQAMIDAMIAGAPDAESLRDAYLKANPNYVPRNKRIQNVSGVIPVLTATTPITAPAPAASPTVSPAPQSTSPITRALAPFGLALSLFLGVPIVNLPSNLSPISSAEAAPAVQGPTAIASMNAAQAQISGAAARATAAYNGSDYDGALVNGIAALQATEKLASIAARVPDTSGNLGTSATSIISRANQYIGTLQGALTNYRETKSIFSLMGLASMKPKTDQLATDMNQLVAEAKAKAAAAPAPVVAPPAVIKEATRTLAGPAAAPTTVPVKVATVSTPAPAPAASQTPTPAPASAPAPSAAKIPIPAATPAATPAPPNKIAVTSAPTAASAPTKPLSAAAQQLINRGYNFGNIRQYALYNWQGTINCSIGGFVCFNSAQNGARAYFMNVFAHFQRGATTWETILAGTPTLAGLSPRSNGNDPESMARTISAAAGLQGPNATINIYDETQMVNAMNENSRREFSAAATEVTDIPTLVAAYRAAVTSLFGDTALAAITDMENVASDAMVATTPLTVVAGLPAQRVTIQASYPPANSAASTRSATPAVRLVTPFSFVAAVPQPGFVIDLKVAGVQFNKGLSFTASVPAPVQVAAATPAPSPAAPADAGVVTDSQILAALAHHKTRSLAPATVPAAGNVPVGAVNQTPAPTVAAVVPQPSPSSVKVPILETPATASSQPAPEPTDTIVPNTEESVKFAQNQLTPTLPEVPAVASVPVPAAAAPQTARATVSPVPSPAIAWFEASNPAQTPSPWKYVAFTPEGIRMQEPEAVLEKSSAMTTANSPTQLVPWSDANNSLTYATTYTPAPQIYLDNNPEAIPSGVQNFNTVKGPDGVYHVILGDVSNVAPSGVTANETNNAPSVTASPSPKAPAALPATENAPLPQLTTSNQKPSWLAVTGPNVTALPQLTTSYQTPPSPLALAGPDTSLLRLPAPTSDTSGSQLSGIDLSSIYEPTETELVQSSLLNMVPPSPDSYTDPKTSTRYEIPKKSDVYKTAAVDALIARLDLFRAEQQVEAADSRSVKNWNLLSSAERQSLLVQDPVVSAALKYYEELQGQNDRLAVSLTDNVPANLAQSSVSGVPLPKNVLTNPFTPSQSQLTESLLLNIRPQQVDFSKIVVAPSTQTTRVEPAVQLSNQPLVHVQLEKLSPEEGEQILEATRIYGDPLLDTYLSTDDLRQRGLTPTQSVDVAGVSVAFSPVYDLGDGYVAVVAYVNKDGYFITAQSYYRSNSQGVWRYLPDYEANPAGEVTLYGKGYGEESITLPFEIQQALSEISQAGTPVLKFDNPEFVFAGTTEVRGKETSRHYDYYQQVDANPILLDGDFYAMQGKTAPQDMVLTHDQSPDFSRLVTSWKQETTLYGTVSVEVFPSNNGEFVYMFNTALDGRVWIGGIGYLGDVQPTGLTQSWVSGGDLTTPAYEYKTQTTDQTGGYGNDSMRKNSYVDMYQNYLSKIPVIQQYVAARTAREQASQSVTAPVVAPVSSSAVAPILAVLKVETVPEVKPLESPTSEATTPAAPTTNSIWNNTTLFVRVLRGAVFPASTVFRNVAVNVVTFSVAHSVAGPFGTLVWPILNTGYRSLLNGSYRADVLDLATRVRGVLQGTNATAPATETSAPAPQVAPTPAATEPVSEPTPAAGQTVETPPVATASVTEPTPAAGSSKNEEASPVTPVPLQPSPSVRTAPQPVASTPIPVVVPVSTPTPTPTLGGGGTGGTPPIPPTPPGGGGSGGGGSGGSSNGGSGIARSVAKVATGVCTGGIIRFGICSAIGYGAYSWVSNLWNGLWAPSNTQLTQSNHPSPTPTPTPTPAPIPAPAPNPPKLPVPPVAKPPVVQPEKTPTKAPSSKNPAEAAPKTAPAPQTAPSTQQPTAPAMQLPQSSAQQPTPSPLSQPMLTPLGTPQLSCSPTSVTMPTTVPISIQWSCLSGTPVSSGFSTNGLSYGTTWVSVPSNASGVLQFSLSCISGMQQTAPVMCYVSIVPPASAPKSATSTTAMNPTVALIANPAHIASGGTVNLSWTSVNASICTVNDPSGTQIGSQATSSTAKSPVLTATTIFTAVCTDPIGQKVIATTTVSVP